MRAFLITLAALLIHADPLSAQQPVSEYAGCYRIVAGRWDPRLTTGYHPDPRHLARAVQLDTLPLLGWPMEYLKGARQARVLSLPADTVWKLTYWQAMKSDSIFIGTPLSFGGFDLMVAGDVRRMTGYVTASTDQISKDHPSAVRAPVALERVDCAQPLPPR